MIQLKKRTKLVFHYTRLATALIYILPQQSLRMSATKFVNDPLETSTMLVPMSIDTKDSDQPSIVLSHIPNDLTDEDIPHVDIYETLNRVRNNEWHVLCMSFDDPKWDETAGTDRQVEYTYRGHGMPAMWAHYADNHQGVCLIFKAERLNDLIKAHFKESGCIFSGPVQYKQDLREIYQTVRLSLSQLSNEGLEKTAKSFLIDHYKEFFFTKFRDWSHEREYRWAVFNEQEQSDYSKFHFGDALQSVVVGSRVDQEAVSALQEFKSRFGFNLIYTYWEDGHAHFTKVNPDQVTT